MIKVVNRINKIFLLLPCSNTSGEVCKKIFELTVPKNIRERNISYAFYTLLGFQDAMIEM